MRPVPPEVLDMFSPEEQDVLKAWEDVAARVGDLREFVDKHGTEMLSALIADAIDMRRDAKRS